MCAAFIDSDGNYADDFLVDADKFHAWRIGIRPTPFDCPPPKISCHCPNKPPFCTTVQACLGKKLHEDPQVPNYGPALWSRGQPNPRLRPGMVLAVEPMINLGTHEVETLPDGWTVVTRDGKLSAHWEHTIAVTDEGPLVLTRR